MFRKNEKELGLSSSSSKRQAFRVLGGMLLPFQVPLCLFQKGERLEFWVVVLLPLRSSFVPLFLCTNAGSANFSCDPFRTVDCSEKKFPEAGPRFRLWSHGLDRSLYVVLGTDSTPSVRDSKGAEGQFTSCPGQTPHPVFGAVRMRRGNLRHAQDNLHTQCSER